MATTARPSPETTLQIKRLFTAPQEKVFQAWTDPQKMTQWFLRVSKDHVSTILSQDLRAGGSYHAAVTTPEGQRHVLKGTYREVRPPEKLVFTWQWQDSPEPAETLVTVEFHAKGTFTEVVLTHELFPNAESCQKHTMGWNGCFDTLAKVLGG